MWIIDTPVWSQMQMIRKADHLICEKHEYKTGQHALTCSQSSSTDRTFAIRSVSGWSAPTRPILQEGRPRFVSVHDSYTRHLPIGSPIILNDGSRARACQLSTWAVNLCEPWETILGRSAERLLHSTDRYIYAVNLIAAIEKVSHNSIFLYSIFVYDDVS